MKTFNAILVIAYRDLLKFFHDRTRIIATFIFPIIFIGVLGKGFQSSIGNDVKFDYLLFIFTGVLAQTLFQSAASGIISLIEDRENDFSQEIFISPIPRTAIILGKVLGESSVALIQALGIIAFGLIIGVSISFIQLLSAIPIMIMACLFGASFGVIVLGNLSSQRAANQIFPFVIFPQIFLSGIFNPVTSLPWYLDILSKISPLTYIVDMMRGVVYSNFTTTSQLVARPVWLNFIIIVCLFLTFITVGTALFTRNEKNK